MNLGAQLAQLEDVQLVRAVDAESYFFKHALTQETAYESLLKKARRDIHRQVAQAIEMQYANRLDEFAALLARHYAAAEDPAKTLEYATRAGDASARVYANAEAVVHYSVAIDAANRIQAFVNDLYLKRGRELELASQFPAALTNYQEMERVAHTRGDRALELGALVAQCKILGTPNSEFNPGLGEPLAEKALRLARELGDRAAEAKVLWILINLYRFTDRSAQAREVGEASLKIARELNLREQMGFTLNDLAHAYVGEDFGYERELIQEATRIWRQLGNLPMLADSLSTFSLYGSTTGHLDEVIEFSSEAFQISQSIGNLWGQTYSLSTVGIVHWLRGDIALGISAMEESLRLSALSGYPVPQLLTRADLGVAYASLGEYEVGLEHATDALEFAEAHMAPMRLYAVSALVQIYLWMGDYAQAAESLAGVNFDPNNSFIVMYGTLSQMRLAARQGDSTRALEVSRQMLEYVKKFGLRTLHPEALYYKGLAEKALGKSQAARESLIKAHASADSLRARWIGWQILGELGVIEFECGNRLEAEELLDKARELITYIADHSPSDSRESFLNLPNVRKVMSICVEK